MRFRGGRAGRSAATACAAPATNRPPAPPSVPLPESEGSIARKRGAQFVTLAMMVPYIRQTSGFSQNTNEPVIGFQV